MLMMGGSALSILEARAPTAIICTEVMINQKSWVEQIRAVFSLLSSQPRSNSSSLSLSKDPK
jgi:hypothetical protein